MYRVFSRQTPSAELISTASGVLRQPAPAMDTNAYLDKHIGGSLYIGTHTQACAGRDAEFEGSRGSRVSPLERKPTPITIPDITYGSKSPSPRRYRRSCHGTVVDDERQGGTAVRGSWQALPPVNSNCSDSVAYVVSQAKQDQDLSAAAVCKDVGSRRQQDQQQQESSECAGYVWASKDTAEFTSSPQPRSCYATPFAAPEVQACTCHKRFRRCKQHPNSMQQLVNQFKQMVTCGGHLAVF